MDVKITKGRFANLIAYDLVKIIISIIAAIMVWVLLFTMCATRATVGEQFGLIVFDGVYYKDNYAEDVILKLKRKRAFLTTFSPRTFQRLRRRAIIPRFIC